MKNEITNPDNNSGSLMWGNEEQLKEIRTLFAPNLTGSEFQYFVGLGKATGLNPFLREIWCVKYDDNNKSGKPKPAQVFIGRDGYRKAAQAHADYDYHQADAVYENDKFEVINGEVRHSYTLSKRGKLIGAYCIAKRHKSSRPQYVFAELEEYTTGQSLWAEAKWNENKYGGKYKSGGKPATMIKKVAESQCLRAAFQDLLGGTYGEEERMKDLGDFDPANSKSQKTNKSPVASINKILEGEVVETPEKIVLEEEKLEPVEQKKLDEAVGAIFDCENLEQVKSVCAMLDKNVKLHADVKSAYHCQVQNLAAN